MKPIKEFLYKGKHWLKAVFQYPARTLTLASSQDYDAYWKVKRGKRIGELSEWQEERASYIVNILKRESGSIELGDVGCGDGSILAYLNKNLSNIAAMYGYDSSDFALEKARESSIQTHRFEASNVESFDSLGAHDYYLLLEVLEHVPHSEALLFAALRKSRRGVFFSFPNTGFITYRLRLLFGKFPLQWKVFPNEHVRFWTYADLKWWLNALDIKNFEIYPYKGIPFLNGLLPGLFAAGFMVYVKAGEKAEETHV